MRLLQTPRDLSLIFALVLTTASISAASADAGLGEKKTAPLAWSDISGRKYGVADVAKNRATVFVFISTQCPISNLYLPRLFRLGQTYSTKGVGFFLVDSNIEDTAAVLRRYVTERSIAIPVVKDTGTAFADRLDAHVTPEAVVVDSAGVVRYRGRIDDNREPDKVVRQDLKEALDALLEGKSVTRSRTLPFGCAIFRSQPKTKLPNPIVSAVTYAQDVAPILNQNCVVCHRTGEVAPFSLETYQQARTWASQIKDYTTRRIMPPWKAVPGYGEFHDTRYLNEKQIATLARWAGSGAKKGDPKDMPPSPRFPDPAGWTLGSPDMVMQPARDYHLEAEGRDVYRNFVLPVDFKEDRLVSAVEFKPGNRSIVHHIVMYMDLKGDSVKLDGKEKEPGYTVPGIGIGVVNAQWGDVWVPGNSPRPLPKGMAIRIPAGCKLVMQVHYHKTGKPEVDRSQMALYFAKEKVEKVIRTTMMGDMLFRITPGVSRYPVKSTLVAPVDMTLWSIFPHMHMLGKEMKIIATLPDGKVMPLIYIDDWDFNWQATYFYKEPMKLPRGTKIELSAYYDNSESNPHQTAHPPRLVTFGEQTTDEMCFCFFGLTFDREKTATSLPSEKIKGAP